MKYFGIALVWACLMGFVVGVTSLQPAQDRADIAGWMGFFALAAGVIVTGFLVDSRR